MKIEGKEKIKKELRFADVNSGDLFFLPNYANLEIFMALDGGYDCEDESFNAVNLETGELIEVELCEKIERVHAKLEVKN